MTPPVVVIGGGAMGGAFASAIAQSGQPTVIVDPAPAVIEAIRARGLRVSAADGERETAIAVTADPRTVGIAGVVLVFVKAPHTAAAAASLAPLLGEGTVVATLQNGWGNADVLAAHVPMDRLVVGVTYHSATVAEPGVIRHTGRGMTFLGPFVDGAGIGPAEAVGEVLGAAGFETTVTGGVKTEIWRKLVLNAATLPVAALTGLRAGQLGEPGAVRDLVDALASEAVRVGRAMGFEVDEAERLARIHAVLEGAGAGKPSMLQDVEAHRLTEIDTINGAVTRLAATVGERVPLCQAMTALVHGLERLWQPA